MKTFAVHVVKGVSPWKLLKTAVTIMTGVSTSMSDLQSIDKVIADVHRSGTFKVTPPFTDCI